MYQLSHSPVVSRSWLRLAARPVDGASLAVFRIGFGLMVAWEGFRYLDRGWVDAYYPDGGYTFTYWPFDFVQPLPGPLTPLPWLVMGLAGLAVAAGVAHRSSTVVAWLTLAYAVLIDKTQYLNHLYLMALLAFLLIWIPCDRTWSVGRNRTTDRREQTVPALALAIIGFQVAVPYVLGGLAKLNGDWLDGRPLSGWLASSTDVPLVGPWLDSPMLGLTVSWLAVLIDLTVVAYLLWRPTRPWAYLVAVAFHIANARLFSIGVFPWLMIAATTVLLPPSWPRGLLATLRNPVDRRWLPTVGGAALGALVGAAGFPSIVITHVVFAAFGVGLGAWLLTGDAAPTQPEQPEQPERPRDDGPEVAGVDYGRRRHELRPWVLTVAAVWVVIQLAVPFRYLLHEGDVRWTEDGHRFSWRMKLRDKDASIALFVVDDNGRRQPVDLAAHLTSRQIRKMAGRPDMIVQFAHYLEDEADRDLVVVANSVASVNGRPEQVFVDPTVDLTSVDRPRFGSARFLLPLDG